jgi:hypothetical protein
MFVCCECCVLSGRSLCDGLITRPEESYRLWCVVVCHLETSKMRRLKPATRLWKIQPQRVVTPGKQTNKRYSYNIVFPLQKTDSITTHCLVVHLSRIMRSKVNELFQWSYLQLLSVKFWDWVCKKYKIKPHN